MALCAASLAVAGFLLSSGLGPFHLAICWVRKGLSAEFGFLAAEKVSCAVEYGDLGS